MKSRLLPLHIRPNPPLLAPTPILGAYNHAHNPASFDMRASARESLAAQQRTHPGAGTTPDMEKIKAEKAAWNDLINWVMSERRAEKLRLLEEERSKRLAQVAQQDPDVFQGVGQNVDIDPTQKKRKTCTSIVELFSKSSKQSRSSTPENTIFGPGASAAVTPRRGSPALTNGFIRPALSTPQRSNSPRMMEKRRALYNGVGGSSPRGRTYTPPRILPSCDETAPFANGNVSAPSRANFDFVSPLGPVKMGRLESPLQRSNSLDVVQEEEAGDDDCGGDWELVQSRRTKRAGSMPCRHKTEILGDHPVSRGQQVMTVDA